MATFSPDFVSSPPSTATAHAHSPSPSVQLPGQQPARDSGPLFNLLTSSHPLLATTIEGASSAYGGAKNFSPRFKSSAEYVEGYLTPLANTVGSVGRVTGVEGGVRWFLSRRQGADLEAAGGSKKRRKPDTSGAEPSAKKRFEAEGGSGLAESGAVNDSFPPTPTSDSRLSIASAAETLPAYDDMRSPAYTETTETPGTTADSRANAPWKQRIFISTSGLSVAMSDESLRSLKYCLRGLRWANEHIGGVINNLKSALEQYDQPETAAMMADMAAAEKAMDSSEQGAATMSPDERAAHEASRAELALRINTLRGDVLKTLQDAINMVSRYAGGALPENARVLVRRHLTSLPQRFRLAAMSEQDGQSNGGLDKDSSVRDGAHKALVLAKEGLDMVTQVSAIVDGTIVSAEEWCERMGRKRPSDATKDAADAALVLPQHEPREDVKMG